MANLGQQFVRQSLIAKKRSDAVLAKIQRDVKTINKYIHKLAIQSYDVLVDRLDIENGVVIVNSMDNLEKLSIWMPSFDMLLNRYRVDYRRAYQENQAMLYETLKDKELRLMKVVAKMGVTDDRITPDQNTIDLMNAITNNMYKNIENMLVKWRAYVYDTFFQGISQTMTKDDLRSRFLNTTGTLRIGSSLEEMSELEASIAAVAEKTAYLRDQAKKNGYKYCWNVNPMDARTKAICMMATLAGVISETEMLNQHGFPPRFICRCEIAFTHGDWVEFNQAINEDLRGIRQRLIQELGEAPRQLAQYYIGGRLIVPTDPVRAAGLKMYADIEEKLELARETEVPDFELYE